MIKNNLVSVIMPVFNSSEYLQESLQSMLDQTHENWELICINDGSTDNSLDILKAYERKDCRIKILHQENLGPSQARKLGISNSSGEYISYLDSDDKYSNDYLSETLNQAIATDADVIMPILVVDFNSKNPYNFNDKNYLKHCDEILPRKAFLRTFPWTVHGINLYKSSHIKKYALTDISDVNNFNADEYLTRYLLLFSNKIVVSKGTYYYRNNPISITKKFTKKHFSSLKVYHLLFNLAISEDFLDTDLERIANEFLVLKSVLKYKLIINRNDFKSEEISDLFNELHINSEWEKYVNLKRFRILKYYLFFKLNLKLSIFLVKLKDGI